MSRPGTSEAVSKRELYDARIERRSDLSELRSSEGCVNTGEVRVIEDVEQLAAKLDRLTFLDPKILIKRHVKINDAWSPDDSLSGITEEAVCWPANAAGLNHSLTVFG